MSLSVFEFVLKWIRMKSAQTKKLGYAKLSLTVPGNLNH